MKGLICLLLILNLSSNKAQNAPNFPTLIPPTPQAQLYMRYGDIPVNLSSGVPNINIPIYDIEIEDLRFPIDISYHASGNKVKDISSVVGLGWVLNAGGIIVQSVNNSYDSGDFFFKSIDEATNLLYQQAADDVYNVSWIQYSAGNLYPQMGGGDPASDRYFYNFNGNIGVFYYNIENGQIENVPYSPMRINKINKGFEITTTDGVIWSFIELGSSRSSLGIIGGGSVEYYLSNIKLPQSGEDIVFTYGDSESYSILYSSQTGLNQQIPEFKSIYTDYGNVGYGKYDLIIDVRGPDLKAGFGNASTHVHTTYPLLTKIEWKNNSILLNYKKDRIDAVKCRLDNIIVKAQGDSIINATLLNNKYLGNDSENYRMLLDGILVNGMKYGFEYDQTLLPKFGSYSEDFWGYYNRIPSSENLPFMWHNHIDLEYRSIREPNFAFTQAGILKKVIYPTGGWSSFEYEQNKGTKVYASGFGDKKPSDINEFGGLRIKKINNYDGSNLEAKIYEYEGYATTNLTLDHFRYNYTKFYVPDILHGPAYNHIVTHPEFGINDLFASEVLCTSADGNGYPLTDNGSLPFYNKVTEYKISGENRLEKTEYEFLREGPYSPDYIQNNDRGAVSPLLSSKKMYRKDNNSYTLIKEENYKYKKITKGQFLTGIRVKEINKTDPDFIEPNINHPARYYLLLGFLAEKGFQYHFNFDLSEKTAIRDFELLEQLVTKEYKDGKTFETKIDYSYDPSFRVLTPIETIKTNSNMASYKEEITHPFNYTTIPYTSMVSKNIISPAVKTSITYNNNNISNVFNEYRLDGTKFVVDRVSVGSNDVLESRLQYHNYDQYGNPLYISKDDATKVVYLWGYNGQYPIAEIKNATYDQVKAALGVAPESLSSAAIPDYIKIEALRTNTNLLNALITTYTYKPLVGILTATDPRGVVTSYEYDSFNRLSGIKDANGKLINTYDYHYQNQ